MCFFKLFTISQAVVHTVVEEIHHQVQICLEPVCPHAFTQQLENHNKWRLPLGIRLNGFAVFAVVNR